MVLKIDSIVWIEKFGKIEFDYYWLLFTTLFKVPTIPHKVVAFFNNFYSMWTCFCFDTGKHLIVDVSFQS